MLEDSLLKYTLGYNGPERRMQERRTPIHLEDRDWRIQNLALVGSDTRGSLGRRASDYFVLSGTFH